MKKLNRGYKIAGLIIFLILALGLLSSCMIGNRGIGLDTKQTFRYANIYLNGEWQDVKVNSWRDFENSDSIQITINGNTYYTHLCNVVLMENPRNGGASK